MGGHTTFPKCVGQTAVHSHGKENDSTTYHGQWYQGRNEGFGLILPRWSSAESSGHEQCQARAVSVALSAGLLLGLSKHLHRSPK